MTTHLTTVENTALAYAETDAGEGNPLIRTGIAQLEQVNGTTFGVWEVEPGILEGVPVDEVFIVLTGDATITSDGETEPIVVGPGDVVRLVSGQKVRWEIRETIRKVYVHP